MSVTSISGSAGVPSVGSSEETEDTITDPTEEDPSDEDAQIANMIQNGSAPALMALYSGSNKGTAPTCEQISQALTGQASGDQASTVTPSATYSNTPSTAPSPSASSTMSAMTRSSMA